MDKNRVIVCLAPIALAIASIPARAQTVTVDTVEDYIDFPAPQTVAQLPGPDGFVSFSEALAATNNTPGPQTIGFAIPRDQWWLLDNVALLRQELLFLITDDETTVDFSTQTLFTGDTNPAGNEVAIYGIGPGGLGTPSIWIMADRCVIKGLGYVYQRGSAIRIDGNHNRVIGCVTDGGLYAAVEITGGFGGPSRHDNIIGGTGPGEGNFLTAGGGGVSIVGPADHNIVIGNVLTGPSNGIEVIGSTQYGLVAADNRIGGPTRAERNIISGSGKYGEEGLPGGNQIRIEDADRTIIEGNYIGTNADGTAPPARQIGPGGVGILRARDTVVRNNLISGLRSVGFNHYAGQVFGVAISIAGESSGTVIQGNLIGTDATGAVPIATHSGIVSTFFPGEPDPTGTIIGGRGAGEANTIAFTETVGVGLFHESASITISGNAIYGNAVQGIDLQTLQGWGVTPNDVGDSDTGANGLQNFPVIDTARISSGTRVAGSLNSNAGRGYALEFFASPACDASGHGQGALFLGSIGVTTDGQGNARFDALLTVAAGAGDAITATATDLTTGDTSEFSACVTAEGGSTCPADMDGNGVLNVFDFLAFQTAFSEEDPVADLSPPFGVLNVFDFLAFQTAFGEGC